jgi:hypothetical protein
MTSINAPVFAEKNFEVLASALDRLQPTKRELFLTKLVILLSSCGGDTEALENFVNRAQKDL